MMISQKMAFHASESEEYELDLSDPDAGAYSNSEGEDTDGNTSE